MNLENYPASWKLMPTNAGRMTPATSAAYRAWLARDRRERDVLRARKASGDEYMELAKRQRERDQDELDAALEAEDTEQLQHTAAREAVLRSPKMKAIASEARAAAIAEARSIIGECDTAGVPERAKGFIDKDLSIDEVRTILLKLRAEKSEREEIVSRHIDNSSGAHDSATDNYGWDRAFARAAGQRATRRAQK